MDRTIKTRLRLVARALAVTAAASFAAASAVAGPSTVGVEWPVYRYDLGRTSYNPNEHILSPSTVPGLKLAWTFDTRLDADSSPVVAGGIAYFGSDSGYLFAVDARTGRKQWVVSNGTAENTSPAVDRDTVYIVGANKLHAFNRFTGALRWESPMPKKYFAHSSPAIDHGVIYTGGDDGLYAFNARSGAPLWKFTTNAQVAGSPAVDDGLVFATTGATVYAIDEQTHMAKWSYDTGSKTFFVQPSAAVSGGIVYFSYGGTLHAIDEKTGKGLWKVANRGFTVSSPAVANGLVYVGATTDHSIHALDARTGVPRWSYETEWNIAFTAATVANGVVYIGSYDGRIYALDAATGAKLWSYMTGGIIEASPTVADGMLLIPSDDYLVYGFSLAGGPAKPTPLKDGCQTSNAVSPGPEGAIPSVCRFNYRPGATYSGDGVFKITCSGGGGPFTTPGFNLPLSGCSGVVSIFAFGKDGGAGFPGGGTVVAGDIAPVETPGACDAACLDRTRARVTASIATYPKGGETPPPW